MLTAQGIERTVAQRCIGHYITALWALDRDTANIAYAHVDGTQLVVLCFDNDSELFQFDLEGYL